MKQAYAIFALLGVPLAMSMPISVADDLNEDLEVVLGSGMCFKCDDPAGGIKSVENALGRGAVESADARHAPLKSEPCFLIGTTAQVQSDREKVRCPDGPSPLARLTR